MKTSSQTALHVVPSGDWAAKNLLRLLLLTVAAFLIMGYHPGLEDDAFYLAAIKRNLNPTLFPHDAEFFRLQFQATIFDKLIAWSVRLTHLPLAWAALLWQLSAIFLLLHGCWRISRRCFSEPPAQWAAVTMITALLTLPVTGTGLNLADQYLHPRNLAGAAIVAAIVAVLDRRAWLACLCLAFAFANHAIMGAFGISFCIFLWWTLSRQTPSALPMAVAALAPQGWMFEPSSDAWRQAAATRSFYFLGRWEWYEWLGVFAPLILIDIFRRTLKHRAESAGDGPALRPFVTALLYFGVFQTIIGLAIMLPPSLERLRPFEPMRYLHLVYLMFFLLVGALLGRYVLSTKDGRHPESSRSSGGAKDLARIERVAGEGRSRARLFRWALLFVPLGAIMFYSQRQMYPATERIEWPGASSKNSWLQAFVWIRQNTPPDALFALDPHYVKLPGEDYHGFRALAERSVLADYVKDGGMAARVPSLAPRWLREVNAQTGWQKFGASDFQRLKEEFGVSWVVLSRADVEFSNPLPGLMTCPYANDEVKVCRLNQ
ncbi:MAG TPA: DUF6798 domain-containing protein [Candidatus Nitrosotalea sp.]|nr:DUF6798 domain-containing protein [Candidatus Nitrosotalea sp.]